MTTAEISNQTLREAYQAIAERRGEDSAALDNTSISESELLSALAYVLGIPLVESHDLSDALLSEGRALTAELETDALMDYQFVPIARRGETLVVISSCPWDSISTEVLLGYFQHCSRVKFVLASPECVRELLKKLRPAEPKFTDARPVDSEPQSPAKAAIPQPPTPVAQSRERSAAPIVLPPGARPSAKNAARNSTTGQTDAEPLLTPEDVTRLMNILAGEFHRLIQQKSQRSL